MRRAGLGLIVSLLVGCAGELGAGPSKAADDSDDNETDLSHNQPGGEGGSNQADSSSASSGGASEGPDGQPSKEPFQLPELVYEHGDPSGLEQELLEVVQRARANPAAEGEIIVELPEVQGAIESFGVNPSQVKSEFASYSPAPPLSFNPLLAQAARFHSKDMATKGFQEHDGSAGEEFWERIEDAGYEYSSVSENIFAYAKSIPYCNAAFLIDWGNPGLGHRKALLDLEDRKREVGISVIEDPPSSNVGPLVVTQDFGMPQDDEVRFVVGVVFADKNGDGTYQSGEGEGGIRIVPEAGGYYAVSSESGGFSIPVEPFFGSFRVQAQRDGSVVAESEITVNDENVKLDFVLAN